MTFDVSIINTVLIAIGGIILIIQQRQNKATNISSEVIGAYEKQVNQLKEEVQRLGDAQLELTHQLEKLQITLTAKDDQIKTLTDLVQNRNPELVGLITDVKNFLYILNSKVDGFFDSIAQETHVQTDYLKEAKKRHDDIDREFGPQLQAEVDERKKNTQMLTSNQDRNKKIDDDTRNHKGQLMRRK